MSRKKRPNNEPTLFGAMKQPEDVDATDSNDGAGTEVRSVLVSIGCDDRLRAEAGNGSGGTNCDMPELRAPDEDGRGETGGIVEGGQSQSAESPTGGIHSPNAGANSEEHVGLKIGTPVKWPCVEELARGEIVGFEERGGKLFYRVEGETVRGLRVASSLRRDSELVCVEAVKDIGVRTEARAA